ncbi:MAG: rRNA maturation RNase YbeY [Chitinophagales bacterium]
MRKFRLPKQRKVVDWILLVSFLEKRIVDDLSYIFCDDPFLLKLNKQYLYHSTYTDIITFDYSSNKKLAGEIYISTERVRKNAASFESTFEEELRRVMIHGVLHCIGYSDKSKRDQLKMRKKESEYLILFNEMD